VRVSITERIQVLFVLISTVQLNKRQGQQDRDGEHVLGLVAGFDGGG
jgi:hypothetical protein